MPPPPSTAAPLDRLATAIGGLEAQLGLGLTIIDYGFILTRSSGRPVFEASRHSHQKHAVCRIGYGRRCVEHCRYAMNARGGATEEPFVHLCWKGVQELVVPLRWQGRYLGNLFAGPWRHPDGEGAPSEPELPAAMVEAYWALPVLDPERVAAISPVLWLAARGIAAELATVLDLSHGPQSRRAIIEQFLHYGSANPVQLEDLAGMLRLSVSRAGKVVREELGETFLAALTARRMARAAELLRQSGAPLAEIARQVGMGDGFHFSRSFSRHVGVSPSAYRCGTAAGEGVSVATGSEAGRSGKRYVARTI